MGRPGFTQWLSSAYDSRSWDLKLPEAAAGYDLFVGHLSPKPTAAK